MNLTGRFIEISAGNMGKSISVLQAIRKSNRLVKDWLLLSGILSGPNPVLICQMGKVGSSTLYSSLRNHYAGITLHCHSFTNSTHPSWLVRSLFVAVIRSKRPKNIISLTREPVGRNISAFFQRLSPVAGAPCSAGGVAGLCSRFLTEYQHDIPYTWFDEQIRKEYGLDVYATPFPQERGWAEYDLGGGSRLLVIKSEVDDAAKEKTICHFLQLDKLDLSAKNTSKEKWYAALYKDFLAHAILPAEYIDRACSSKYFRHFYSENEIEKVRAKWMSRINQACIAAESTEKASP